MNEAACSCRTTTGLILLECLSASSRLAEFSPGPPKIASTPIPSNPLTIASYTRIGGPSDRVAIDGYPDDAAVRSTRPALRPTQWLLGARSSRPAATRDPAERFYLDTV